jgi:hypothetical protein
MMRIEPIEDRGASEGLRMGAKVPLDARGLIFEKRSMISTVFQSCCPNFTYGSSSFIYGAVVPQSARLA